MIISNKVTLRAAAVLAVLILSSSLANADTTLQKIKDNGVIRVGIDFGRPPWAFKTKNLHDTGYDVATARLIAKDLGVKLHIVEFKLTDRIPFLISGKVDGVVSTFSITKQRSKVVDFSIPYGSAIVTVGASRDAKIQNVKDLSGMRVGVTRGSTNDSALTEKAPKSTRIVRFEDTSTTMSALTSGQVQAAVTDPNTIKAVAKNNPNLKLQLKFTLTQFPIGVGFRKQGEKALENAVNESIRKNLKNGKLNMLYKKFIGVGLTNKILSEVKSDK